MSPASTPSSTSAWTQRPERSQVPIVRFMVWLSLRTGRSVSRVLLHGIALYFLLFSPRARGHLQTYYQRLWGQPAGWRQLYRHFFSFASMIHDRVFLLNGQHDQFDITLHGREALDAAMRGDQGVVIMGAHFGSFEVLKSLGDAHGQTVHMLMYAENASKLNAILAAINPQAAAHIIALNRVDSMLVAREKLAHGDWLGLLADRTFANDATTARCFLGAPAPFPTGPLRLAALLGCPVVFLSGVYVQGNRYHIHAASIADFRHCPRSERASRMEEAQQRYVAQLEALCRQYPHNWFNFFDFWNPCATDASKHPTHTSLPDN